jgi:acetoin utilization deacetylase AcuC-like enzyme
MLTYFHDDQSLHHPRTYLSRGQMRAPQEIPARTPALLQGAQRAGCAVHAPDDHGLAPVLAVHSQAYVDFLRTAHHEWTTAHPDWGDEVMSNIYRQSLHAPQGILAKAAHHLADGSCPIGAQTWVSAYQAAQCAAQAATAVLNGERAAYALCRPPGHHARTDAAGGFCYLNNAAIAAQMLRQSHERVVILDVDMHHGQGIQEIFYQRADVMYISIHGDPTDFYPVVAGHADERGQGEGLGFNLNLPMAHHSSESVFFDQLDIAVRALQDFKPGALVLPLGFDTYVNDPQSLVAVSTEGFARMARILAQLRLPTVIVQEGGYDLPSLADNTHAFFQAWTSA